MTEEKGQKTILAVDCGTQSLRAALFSDRGDMPACAKIEYDPYLSPRPGWAEQDPELYWKALAEACLKLKAEAPDAFAGVSGVGVTTQRASMINVDKDGRPLRPCILWPDQRRAGPFWGHRGLLKLGLTLAGLDKRIRDIQTQGKCNWIMQNQPDIWEKTHKYLQISGFLNHRLTGTFHDATASQIGHVPFDYKNQKWAGRFRLSPKLFPIEPDKLPTLFPSGECLGKVTATASRQCGIPAGTPVVACGSDKGCETLGAGVLRPDRASLSFGTTATIQTLSESYLELIRYMPAYPSPVNGHYNLEVEIFRGFWMISWFKRQFAAKEVEQAEALGISAEEVLNRCLENTPAGAMGLVVQPYWAPGLGKPLAKGAMIGFGDVHTRDHIYRAVIEGLGFGLYEGLEKIEGRTGTRIQQAAVSGGASQSSEICRIMADIFNLPMTRGQTHETSALGAAVLTAVGLGWYAGVKEAVERMIHVKTVFEPDPGAARLYRDLYTRVYARLYKALEPLYTQIRDITGYPEWRPD